MRTSFVSTKECQACRKAIGDDMNKLATDAAVADARRDALPTAKEMTAFAVAMEGVRGDLQALNARVEGQGELLKRIERPVQLLMDYHLQRERQ